MGKIVISIISLTFLLTACDNNKHLPKGSSNIVCTTEVKACSDGSYVSRNPDNNCEFDPCPTGEISQKCHTASGCNPVIRLPAN